MAKYDPLRTHLSTLAAEGGAPRSVQMTFEAIGELVGGLPASARRHAAWWANEGAAEHGSGRSSGHVQAAAWLGAGFEVESVDLHAGWVRFTRQWAGCPR